MSSHEKRTSKSVVWLTPKYILDALGPFDLDPCAAFPRPWPTATHMLDKRDDGLAWPWDGRVWLNPPYGYDDTATWMERMVEHNKGTALIFARMETEVWQRFVLPKASGILFFEGRLRFCDASGNPAEDNAGCGSALVAYGKADARRLRTCGLKGFFINPNP